MNIPGGSILWWRRVDGGLVMSDPSYEDGMLAEIRLPSLPGGQALFYLPEESASLHAFLIGLDHGFELGATAKANEMRRMLGVETYLRTGVKGGIGHAARKP